MKTSDCICHKNMTKINLLPVNQRKEERREKTGREKRKEKKRGAFVFHKDHGILFRQMKSLIR